MKQKFYKLWVLAFLLMMPFIGKAVTVTDSAAAANVQVCLKPEIVRLQFSVGGTGTTGSYLDIKLPNGFTWEGLAYGPIVTGGSGSNSITYAGVFAGKHRLTFGSSTALQTIRLGFWQKASCGAGTSSFTTRDSLFFYEGSGSINASATNAFNGDAPDYSITSITNTPATTQVGQTVSRSFTITNGGLGASSRIFLTDNYLNAALTINTSSFRINPSGVNYSVPTSQIVNNGDSVNINLLANHIQQIGDGDTLFEFGESFILQYTFTANNCGVSNNINSLISAAWGCGGSLCQRQTVSTDLQVPVLVPDLKWDVQQLYINSCWNTYDSVMVRIVNTSSNLAGNVILSIALMRSGANHNSYYNGGIFARLDTTVLQYKVNSSGTWFKPSITAYLPQTFGEAWFSPYGITGGYLVESRMPNLNGGDTIYVMYRYWKACPGNNGKTPYGPNCNEVVNHLYHSSSTQVRYSDACGTVPYTTNVQGRSTHGDYHILRRISNDGPTDLNANQTGTLSLIENYHGTHSPYNKDRSLRIIRLPADIVYNGSSPVYFGTSNRDTLIYNSTNNTVYLNFHKDDPENYELPIRSVCGVGGMQTVIDELWLVPKNCAGNCDSIRFAQCTRDINVHCPNGPCPRGGYSPNSMTLNRISYGLADANNDGNPDGTLNLNLIKRENFIAGDTMEIVSTGIIRKGINSPSSPFIHGYASINFDGPTGTYIEGVSATIFLKDTNNAGSSTNYTIANLPVVKINKGGSYDFLRVDFSVANLVSGGVPNTYEFDENDSLSIKIIARLGNGTTTSLDRSGYTITDTIFVTHYANPSSDTAKYQCGNYRAKWNLIGLYNFAIQSLTPIEGCNGGRQTILFYSRADGNYGPAGGFPYESRLAALPDTLSITIPSGYSIKHTVWPSYISTSIDTLTPISIIGNTYKFYLLNQFQGYGGLRSIPYEGYNFGIYPTIVPTCKSSGNTAIISSYYTARTVRPWVNNWGSPTLTHISQGSGTSVPVNKPILDITNIGSVTKVLYAKTALWDFNVQNNSNLVASPLTWVYFDPSSSIQVDSVRDLSTNNLITTVNGFYQLGNITLGGANKNFRVYGSAGSCEKDTIKAYVGWDCTDYPTSASPLPCLIDSVSFVLDTASASIQTQITALASTPSDPSNASSTAYGSSAIQMCQGFPFEMTIASTQTGNIYNVKETITLPFNGGTGLDYISDSGYIEYPIGTTPRLFSSAANTTILAQVPTGTMTLDLEQIDPTNFGPSSGLLGTGLGTNATRRAILRWKMKSNCDLVSGDQWTTRQEANSPCGSAASGDSTVTSGFPLNLAGVTNPYVATVKVSTGLDGCGAQTTQIRLEKTGATAPQPSDSITIRLPKLVAAGSMTCSGAACPGGTGSAQAYTVRTDAIYQYLSFQYPNTAGANGDTLLYSFPMQTKDKATCANNQTVKADVYQQLTIYCGAPIPANLCPNAKASLGSETKSFDIRKAILGFTGYSSTYVYPSLYKYRFNGNVANTSTVVAAQAGVTLKTFMDVNNNLTYEKGIDALVKTTVLGSSVPTSGAVAFSDSFENLLYPPSPSLPMYTVIDTGDATANCFCGGVVQSAFNQALPIEFLSIGATNINNLTGKVIWQTNADIATQYFNIYRKGVNDNGFKKIGTVINKGTSSINNFTYYDPISSLADGTIFYQIEGVSNNDIGKRSKIVSIEKSNIFPVNMVFKMQPNPANAQVNIVLNEGLANGTIKITDLNGKVILTQSFEGLNTTINTSQLAAGIYSVQVTSQDGIETQKLSIIR